MKGIERFPLAQHRLKPIKTLKTPVQINTKWFQDQLELRGITQKRLSELLQTHTSTVSNFLNGRRKLQLNEATTLSSLLSIPLDDILMHAGISSGQHVEAGKPILIKGWVDGGLNVHWGEPRGPKTAPRPQIAGKSLGVLRVQSGGSGPAAAFEGGLVYYHAFIGIAQDIIGQLCLVKMVSTGPNGVSGLRVVRKSYQAGAYDLASTGGVLMEENEILESATPVVWIKLS